VYCTFLWNGSQHAVKPYIGSKSRFLPNPPAFDAPLGGRDSRRNIAMPFGIEKLEWWIYQMMKKFGRYVYSFSQNVRTWQTNGHTDRHRMTAKSAVDASIARQKLCLSALRVLQKWAIYKYTFTFLLLFPSKFFVFGGLCCEFTM